jgi:hypothetical protein
MSPILYGKQILLNINGIPDPPMVLCLNISGKDILLRSNIISPFIFFAEPY